MPASRYPVKRYNILVPGIFPLKPPSIDEDLPYSTAKKLEKLHEYIKHNPKNTSKVSRRLERRIRHELRSKSVNMGYVKIAVHAYVYLLWHSQVKDVVLYAQELVTKDNPVIEILLKNKEMHLQILGAELLAHFLKKQSDSVNFNRLEDLILLVCDLCSKMSIPSEGREDKKVLELRVACLRSLREHVALMHKLSVPLGEKDEYVDRIMACVLDNLDSKEFLQLNTDISRTCRSMTARPSSPVGRIWNGLNSLQPMQTFRSRRTQHEASTSFDFGFTLRTANFGEDFMIADGPGPVAAQVLRELGNLTRAARSAERILSVLLSQLDERHGWLGAEIVGTSFDVMHDAFAREHQQFLLFKILLRHAANATYLPFPERISLIKRALEEGLSQDSQMAVLVLSQCLDCLHRQLPKHKFDTENEFIPVATDFGNRHTRSVSGICKLAGLQIVTNAEQDEKTLRSVILCGIVEMARRVEGAMQLVDTLLGVLDKRDQVDLGEGSVLQKGTNISLFECVMAAAEALGDLPEGSGRLPVRKFDNTIYKLLGIVADLPPAQAVYVQGILRMILPVGPKDTSLSNTQTTSVLSSIYATLKNDGNMPYNFSELSALFYTLMSKSTVKCQIKSLQFVRTLWTEAMDSREESRFHDCTAAHTVSVLFLANQCLLSVGMFLGASELMAARLPFVEDALNPSLKPSRQFGGVLAYTTGGYTDDVIENSQGALAKLRHEFSGVELADRIIKAVQDNELVNQEYGDKLGDMIRETFVPEGHLVYHHRQKIGLTRTTTPPEESLSKDAAEELRQRTHWMLSKSNSSRQSHLSNYSISSASEILGSRRDSGFLEERAEDLKGLLVEKSKEEYLQEVLVCTTELTEELQKLPDLDLGDPPLGFMP